MIDNPWTLFVVVLFISNIMATFILAVISSGKTEDLLRQNEILKQSKESMDQKIFAVAREKEERTITPEKLMLFKY